MKIKPFIVLASMLIFYASAFAQERIIDNAGILNVGEKAVLLKKLDSLSLKYNFDLFVLTEKSISKSARSHAEFFLAMQKKKDAALLLVVTGSRDYEIVATRGKGGGILNPTAFGKLESDVVKFLADNPYMAFGEFADNWETFLALDAKGRSYNFFYHWNIVLLIAAWILALATGFAFVRSWKSQMNTALSKTEANAYMVQDSVAFDKKADNFLYSNTTRIAQTAAKAAIAGALIKGVMEHSGKGRGFVGRGGKY